MADSFWAIPDTALIRTPLSILREQASALTQQTQGVLVGEAATKTDVGPLAGKPDVNQLVVTLDVVVPGLNDYRYRVVTYRQPLEMYPGRFFVSGGEWETIEDEDAFVNAVKAALSSQRTEKVLTSLLSQVSAA